MTRLLVLDMGRADAADLTIALDVHAKLCRANGRSLSPGLVDLAARCWEIAKGDSDRQEAQFVALLAAITEGRPVKQILLTVAEAAAAIAVSERQIERLIASGDLASVKVGGSRRIHAADLEDYATNLRRPRSFRAAVEAKDVPPFPSPSSGGSGRRVSGAGARSERARHHKTKEPHEHVQPSRHRQGGRRHRRMDGRRQYGQRRP